MNTNLISGFVDNSVIREENINEFKNISWSEFAHTSSFNVSKDDVSLLKNLDKNGQVLTNTEAKQVIPILMNILSSISEDKVVAYALARLDTIMVDGRLLAERISYFTLEKDVDTLLSILKVERGYNEFACSVVLAKLLSKAKKEVALKGFMDWIIKSINLGPEAQGLEDKQRNGTGRAAVSALMVLLRNDLSRVLFVKECGLQLLNDILRNAKGRAQLTYEVCFVLWTLSYCEQAVELFISTNVLAEMVTKMVQSPREKVVRVLLSSFRNLINHEQVTVRVVEIMIDMGLLKCLTVMKDRKFSDEDVVKDLQALRDILFREYKVLTTMERYEKEMHTGRLAWGVLHTDKFWKQHYMAFEQSEFKLIKNLIQLLQQDVNDEVTIAVTLNDLGEFVRYYPNGKMILKRLGAKKLVMQFLSDDNTNIRKHALQCMSKMMVNKWEFVK